ncbi:MAG: DUF4159 domain-containing protein, partial [Planctomycetota bacterium]|nr:DUF4159 domain-containing protein [Planctomycetota bacterium]
MALAALAALMLLGLAAAEAPARGPRPKAADYVDTSDEAIKDAIDKGAKFLWKLQQADGSWRGWKLGAVEDPYKDNYMDGPTAIIAYALMESGVKPFDKRMTKALTWLEKINAKNDKGLPVVKGYVSKTYCMGLRCQAWLSAIRMKGEYKRVLQRDAKQLILSTANGSYAYDATGKPAAGDNSCSQYGLLGVWAAAMADLEVPRAYWLLVKKHWEASQCNDGGWVYNGKGAAGTGPMSAAGVASLFVCFDNLYSDAFASCNPGADGRNALIPIQRGLDWFDQKLAGTMALDGYYLYGVERIGLASGYKYFGTTDWYRTGLKLLLKSQAADGSWAAGNGGPAVSTAQCMLFLIRGRRPVIFNKLKYDGDWNNRPRDLAMLTRWMGDTFEHEAFWQVVHLKIPPDQWHDAPALVISGSKAPVFGKDDLDKIRSYVNQGGTIFSITECEGAAFDKGMREAYTKLFPEYEIKEAPLSHDLYLIQENLTRANLKFHVISNGIRPLGIHVTRDMTKAWQTYQISAEKWAFQAALNVYLYATDKTMPARGSQVWPAPPTVQAQEIVKVARLKFNGNWNPEPLAYQRFSR